MIEDYEKVEAAIRLSDELEKGKQSGEKEGYLSAKDVREHFRGKTHER